MNEANEEYDKAQDIYESLREHPERDIKGRVRRVLFSVGKKNPKELFGGAFWFASLHVAISCLVLM